MIVPGGFSYGDYLRVGAIARFSPVMESVIAFAREGGLVWGICNGFQVLCEAGLLPGALLPEHLAALHLPPGRHRGRSTRDTPFTAATAAGDLLSIPVKHTTGRYHAPPDFDPAPDRPALRRGAEPERLRARRRRRRATRPATSSASCPTPSTPSTR